MAAEQREWFLDEPQEKNSKRDLGDDYANRRFDTTQLLEKGHGLSTHRDYLAHCFRWGFARKFILPGMRVLDVGCGQDLPLWNEVAHSATLNIPSEMVCVDLNKIKKIPPSKWLTVKDEFEFTSRYDELGKFDLITNFEVIEHMTRSDAKWLLIGFKECLAPGGTLLLSTPVFNGRAAFNHIHEYGMAELQQALELSGFKVIDRFGTFASYPDIKRVCDRHLLLVLDRCREFYSYDVLACFLAPLFPDASRNCVWVCQHADS